MYVERDGAHFKGARATSDFVVRDEDPAVVVRDIVHRVRPDAHTIVFANEKGGVGKSTLAFHTITALCHAGYRVLAIDLDRRQQTLARALDARAASARALEVDLPRPEHFVLEKHSIAQLLQEVARRPIRPDVLVIDVAGHDSPLARRALALADTLVTPVNNSFADVDSIGRLNPATMAMIQPSPFASLVDGLRRERAPHGLSPTDWLVVKNRVRGCEQRLRGQVDRALEHLSGALDFRLASHISERVAYRELLPYGISARDYRLIPETKRIRTRGGDEIAGLVEELDLPAPSLRGDMHAQRPKALVNPRTVARYTSSLRNHVGSEGTIVIA